MDSGRAIPPGSIGAEENGRPLGGRFVSAPSLPEKNGLRGVHLPQLQNIPLETRIFLQLPQRRENPAPHHVSRRAAKSRLNRLRNGPADAGPPQRG